MTTYVYKWTLLCSLVICFAFNTNLPAQGYAKLTKKQEAWIPAPAVIINLWEPYESIDYVQQVGLELKVSPAIGSTFNVKVLTGITILQASNFQQGKIVQVRYDPTAIPFDPSKVTKKVVVESLGGSLNNANNTNSDITTDPNLVKQYKAELLKIDSLHTKIRSYGVSSPAVVLTYTSYKGLNITMNGNNPVVTLEVQVIPDDRPSFKATIEGTLIKESSIPNFQPGQIIHVKYDPNDLSKVAADHSK